MICNIGFENLARRYNWKKIPATADPFFHFLRRAESRTVELVMRRADAELFLQGGVGKLPCITPLDPSLMRVYIMEFTFQYSLSK